jgi:hypothetical protein
VLDSDARDGTITGDASAALRADGRAVRLTSPGARTGSPLLMLDFGQEVAGKVGVRLTGASNPAPELHACFSESRKYMALGTRNDGEAAHAPGCDTANIWIGFPGTAYTEDRDSHTLALPTSLPGTASDGQRRGGFRYLTLFLDGPGSVDVDAVSLQFTPAGGQGADLSRYAGWFLSSDDALNKAWYAGAYTVQLNTDASDTAKSWPYEAGERDHADDQVPHARPGDVIYDGGKRDRIVWQGDLAVQQPVALLTTGDRAAVDNSLSSLAAQQEPDGYVPAESLVGQHNLDEKRTYGEYVTWFVHNMAEHWRFTGDRAYLERFYPALEQAMAWLAAQRDDSGLIGFAASRSCGHYGYSDCGHETYVNALYKRNLDELATLAAALGKDGTAYAASAKAVAAAINARLWDDTAGAYRLSLEAPQAHPQDGNAAAVLTGVAGERAGRALAYLRAHTWDRFGSLTIAADEATSALTPFYAPLPSGFEAQARLGQTEGLDTLTGLDLIRRFWGYQLRQDPQSTLFEHVKTDGSPNLAAFSSLAHGWAAGPTESLTAEVLGVDPTQAGYARFDVAPHPGDLRWAQGEVPTPHGTIATEWTRDGDDAFTLELTVPRATVARAKLPTFGRDVRVKVDGQRAGSAIVDGLEPGRHTLTVRATDRRPATTLRAVLTPQTATAAPGDTVALRLGVSGAGDLRGTVTAGGPDDWNVSPDSVDLDLARDGTPASQELRLYAEVPEDAAGGDYPIRVTVRTRDGATVSATATIRLSVEHRLFDFESDTQGWTAGANVSGVARVGSFANGPGKPFEGSGALEATVPGVDASAPKTVRVDKTLDLADASELHAHLDCYGGAPGATGYEATITVSAGDDKRTANQPISCDSWNTLSVNLAGWAGRASVSRIEVGFRALGTTAVWSPRFQVDDVGVTD